MRELTIFVFFLFLKLSFSQSISKETTKRNRYVKEIAIYNSPHTIVSNVQSSSECGMLCSSDLDCCGYTKEASDINCLMFHYQTSNNCQNAPDGSISVHFIKQFTDCSELPSDKPNGVYRIYPSRQDAVLVYCEMTDAGGGWTVLQRRQDGSEYFYRYWIDYKRGFGDMENDFWLGNDIIHTITSQKQYSVRFDLEDIDGLTAYAEYQSFHVDNEAMNYGLNISGYSGYAGGPVELNYAKYGIVPFSTRDVQNDQWHTSCARYRRSAWWFIYCSSSNINGLYRPGVTSGTAMCWAPWRNWKGLSKTRMMIKPAL